MTTLKLILDTSACSRIARSSHRKEIETHIDMKFRRVVSVPTFWELLHQIEGGDGSRFNDDREVIKVASGTNRPLLMLPNPLSFAVETVFHWPRPSAPISPRLFKQAYALVMKARTRDELYEGVPVIRGMKQVRQFLPEAVRHDQEIGEHGHIERLEWAKRKKVPWLAPDAWASATIRNNCQMALDDGEATELAKRLDAAYQFDTFVWKMATAPNTSYEPKNHGNDWTDMQQTFYLCDPSIELMTADNGICKKVSSSHQANRVHYLPDYLASNELSL
jgi:hypothetical protein